MITKLFLKSFLLFGVVTTSLNAQTVDWTDWTSFNATTNVASGTLLVDGVTSTTVSVTGCITSATVIDESSNVFSGSSYSPSIALGDVLHSDHNGSAGAGQGDFVIAFSSPITNPIFHIRDVHHGFQAIDTTTNIAIEAVALSGNLVHNTADTTRLGADSWTGPFMLTGSDTNNYGTTADGTLRLLGTFTSIKLTSTNEDNIYYQIGDDNYVVPEPSAILLFGISAVFTVLRRKRT